MTLVELTLHNRFRSLPENFTIQFSRPARKDAARGVQPICLVGLNGSGKSNLLQLLANIFYYLELYALSKASGYKLPYADNRTEFGFTIHYLMPVTPATHLSYIDKAGVRQYEEEVSRVRTNVLRSVKISNNMLDEPLFEFYYGDPETITIFGKNEIEQTLFGRLLPNRVIGYSSGSNEILSNPFVKTDFYYVEELRRKTAEMEARRAGSQSSTVALHSEESGLTVNRLFYLDYHSNAMMVVAAFLMKREISASGNETELDIINDIVGIDELISFRFRVRLLIRNQVTLSELLTAMEPGFDNKELLEKMVRMQQITIPHELDDTLRALVKCATAVNLLPAPDAPGNEAAFELYYFVDAEVKKAFRNHFKGETGDKGALYLFEKLYLLNLLNIENYTDKLREQVKAANFSENIYDLLPRLPAEERVFYVDNIMVRKNTGAEVYYKQLSDGEHQYLQVSLSLMLMDENGTLFLMDEPETHFNPEWRSRLVSTLNQIRQRKIELEKEADRQSFELVQDIVLTTHSPFILSDSQPENIYIFKKENGQLALPLQKPDFNTFGASVNQITVKIFGKRDTIAGLAKEKLQTLKASFDNGEKDVDTVTDEAYELGDSVERMMLLDYIDTQTAKLTNK